MRFGGDEYDQFSGIKKKLPLILKKRLGDPMRKKKHPGTHYFPGQKVG